MSCIVGFVAILAGVGLMVGLGIVVILNLIIILEGCVASVTNVQLICALNKNVTSFQCPLPWWFDSYDSASESIRTMSSVIYGVTIAFFVLYVFVTVCAGSSAKN
jgi:hypothetical protein